MHVAMVTEMGEHRSQAAGKRHSGVQKRERKRGKKTQNNWKTTPQKGLRAVAVSKSSAVCLHAATLSRSNVTVTKRCHQRFTVHI